MSGRSVRKSTAPVRTRKDLGTLGDIEKDSDVSEDMEKYSHHSRNLQKV